MPKVRQYPIYKKKMLGNNNNDHENVEKKEGV